MHHRKAWLLLCAFASVSALLSPGRPSAQTVSYGYDTLGRLHTATHPDRTIITYRYDAAGNRTQVTTGAPPPPPPPPAPLSASVDRTTYTRTAASIPEPITCQGHGGTAPYTYWWQFVSGDAHTEPTSDGSTASTGWMRLVPSTTLRNSTWRCRVTDAAATTANSPNVAVSIKTK